MKKHFLIDVDGDQIPVIQSGNHLYVSGNKINSSLVELRPNVYSLLLNGVSHLIHIGNGSDHTLTIDGKTITAQIVNERSKLIQLHRQQTESQKITNELRALMPGAIMKIMVQEGDPVTLGQGLIILEAMKMENELQSPCTGSVTQIHVNEGETVAPDTLLIEFAP